jgi:hypothetical protein
MWNISSWPVVAVVVHLLLETPVVAAVVAL